MGNNKISIILADDHPIMLQGIISELVKAGYNILGTAKNGAIALELIVKHQPSIALLDIEMPLLSGYEVIKHSSPKSPNTKYILMTYHKEKGFVAQAKKFGVHGYLLKEDGIDEIKQCIQTVMQNQTYYSNSLEDGIGKIIANEFKKLTLLTPSERTIIRLVAQGKTSNVIGELLLISTRTVQKHRTNIIAKLGLSSSSDTLNQWAKENYEILITL